MEQLKPGLDDELIERLAEAAGLKLPAQVQAWWRWSDGEREDGQGRRSLSFGGILSPVSLAWALDNRRWWLEHSRELATPWGIPADRLWSPTWLPLLRGVSDTHVVDLESNDAEATPVRWIATHTMTPDDYWIIRVQSIGDMVQLWIEAMDAGLWQFDGDALRWIRNVEDVPSALLQTGLV